MCSLEVTVRYGKVPCKTEKPKAFGLSYLVNEHPPWYLCIWLAFQVGKYSWTFALLPLTTWSSDSPRLIGDYSISLSFNIVPNIFSISLPCLDQHWRFPSFYKFPCVFKAANLSLVKSWALYSSYLELLHCYRLRLVSG